MESKNIIVSILEKIVPANDKVHFLCGEVNYPGETGCVINKFILNGEAAVGSVYGLAIEVRQDEDKEKLFNGLMANENEQNGESSQKLEFKDWKPFDGTNFYPLYWGKSQWLGYRLNEHTKENIGVGSLRLHKLTALKGHTIIYGTILCRNDETNEKELQKKYPNILQTFSNNKKETK